MASAAPAASDSLILRLFHGTDIQSANDILQHGVDEAKAAAWNGSGEFWATSDVNGARWYAISNPASPPAACIGFDLPWAILQALLTQVPVVVICHGEHDYEFLPECFAELNRSMSNCQVVVIP